MSPTCDICSSPAAVTLTAAYPTDERAIHPEWATYPMPMYRLCWLHVPAAVAADRTAAAHTPAYLLRACAPDEVNEAQT